jgi:uncharacterized protein (TIGR03382 family)
MRAEVSMTRCTKLLIALACLAAANPAYAHFKLAKPASWAQQASDGSPQKSPPCGNEGPAVETGAINEYKVGEPVTITIQETTYHPGHYRVSLAPDQNGLPDDPGGDVVAGGGMACGSLAIAGSPTMPLIADGLFVHTKAFSGPQTAQVMLPAGMTCDHCVLQIVEFMGNHGAPCFYHHCANIKISVNGADAGPPGDDDAGTGQTGGPSTGGGCSAQRTSSPALVGIAALGLGLGLRRRRCR